jgi:hypothetical protein
MDPEQNPPPPPPPAWNPHPAQPYLRSSVSPQTVVLILCVAFLVIGVLVIWFLSALPNSSFTGFGMYD